MERNELLAQYNRYIDQVRAEVKDLYWLYNFFFFINSAMIGSVLSGKLDEYYLPLIEILGILLSLYWFSVIRKQRLWRNDWVEKIQMIEQELGYEKKFWMWKYRDSTRRTLHEYVFGKRGLWHWLFILPLAFVAVWSVLLIHLR